jgi:very-short-patch-repair endonuclease
MKIKCKKCGGEFDKKMFKLHVKNSHLNDFKTFDDLDLYVLTERYNLTLELITDIIFKYQNESTVLELVSTFNIPYKSILEILKKHGIKIKNISEAVSQKSVRDKYKTTCLLKYGSENVSGVETIKNKKKATFLENYGVDNVFKTEKFKTEINKIMLEKYGVKRTNNWEILTEEQKNDRIKKLNSGSNVSNLEKRIGYTLDNLNIKFETQYLINRFSYDYYINDINLLIEVNGDFWHANPIKYLPDDILPFPKSIEIKAKDLWLKDKRKNELAIKNGFNIVTIWEMDIKNLNSIELEIFLLNKLNNFINGD